MEGRCTPEVLIFDGFLTSVKEYPETFVSEKVQELVEILAVAKFAPYVPCDLVAKWLRW